MFAPSRAQVVELFENRYACKKYTPGQVVSEEDFAAIIEVARLSPSSMGLEPWHFVRLKDSNLIAEITPYCWGAQDKFPDCSHIVAILGRTHNQMQPDSDYVSHINTDVQGWHGPALQARREKMSTFHSRDLQLQTPRDTFAWVSRQCYIALANMLTAAAMLGVDATPIEGLQFDRVNQILAEAGVFNPEEFQLVVMACFGYGEKPSRPKTRRALSEVFTEF